MEKIIIIGGGIAGLSCLNALLDDGISPLLLEGATIGTPKMCGEFIAPQTVTYLKNWDIGPIQSIDQAIFTVKQQQYYLPFQKPAGAITRSHAEYELAKRAREMGARIREKTAIQQIIPATKSLPHRIYLSSGEILNAKTIFVATGKLGQAHSANHPLPYVGIKLHFKHVVSPHTLFMYSIKDAYFGIVPLSDELSNFACLVKRELVEKHGDAKTFFQYLLTNHRSLQTVFEHVDMQDVTWLEGPAPAFQRKVLPHWPQAFWIGDALASLPPAIGSGFAHGIQTAIMAASAYRDHNPRHYHQLAKTRLKPKLRIGKLLHQIMLNPTFGSFSIPFLRANGWLTPWLQGKIEYT